jgi:uncharacterized membrane protein
MPDLTQPTDPGTTQWKTALVTGRHKKPDGTEVVMLIILRDDTLQVCAFIEPNQAESLAQSLMQTVVQIKTGLVVPAGSSILSG